MFSSSVPNYELSRTHSYKKSTCRFLVSFLKIASAVDVLNTYTRMQRKFKRKKLLFIFIVYQPNPDFLIMGFPLWHETKKKQKSCRTTFHILTAAGFVWHIISQYYVLLLLFLHLFFWFFFYSYALQKSSAYFRLILYPETKPRKKKEF